MISTFEYNSDFSNKKESCKILTLFFDALSFVDRQDKIIKGNIIRRVCKVDSESFEINVRLSACDDVAWIVNAFISQYEALKNTDENLFKFDVQVSSNESSFDVTYKIYSTIPF